MSRALLDVNVLLALVDPGSIDHERAHAWLESEAAEGWASCPVTQLGCVRILSRPKYPGAVAPAQALELLRAMCASPSHEFWGSSGGVDELVDERRVLGDRQFTDAYLLGLAVERGDRFATFDRLVDAGAARGARPEQLVVIG